MFIEVFRFWQISCIKSQDEFGSRVLRCLDGCLHWLENCITYACVLRTGALVFCPEYQFLLEPELDQNHSPKTLQLVRPIIFCKHVDGHPSQDCFETPGGLWICRSWQVLKNALLCRCTKWGSRLALARLAPSGKQNTHSNLP